MESFETGCHSIVEIICFGYAVIGLLIIWDSETVTCFVKMSNYTKYYKLNVKPYKNLQLRSHFIHHPHDKCYEMSLHVYIQTYRYSFKI